MTDSGAIARIRSRIQLLKKRQYVPMLTAISISDAIWIPYRKVFVCAPDGKAGSAACRLWVEYAGMERSMLTSEVPPEPCKPVPVAGYLHRER